MCVYCTHMLLQLYLFKELGDDNLAVAIGEHQGIVHMYMENVHLI